MERPFSEGYVPTSDQERRIINDLYLQKIRQVPKNNKDIKPKTESWFPDPNAPEKTRPALLSSFQKRGSGRKGKYNRKDSKH